jgi:hypothetical protein
MLMQAGNYSRSREGVREQFPQPASSQIETVTLTRGLEMIKSQEVQRDDTAASTLKVFVEVKVSRDLDVDLG